MVPSSAEGKGQKMGSEGAGEVWEPTERGRQKEAKPKRWRVTI